MLCLSICIIFIIIYYLSSCRNPSLLNDFVNLPKKRGDGTRPENWTILHKFAENGNNFISVIDRLDHRVESDIMLPQKRECGDGIQYVNRVFGGDFTSISEFPWMVLLMYNTNSSKFLDFSLINVFRRHFSRERTLNLPW